MGPYRYNRLNIFDDSVKRGRTFFDFRFMISDFCALSLKDLGSYSLHCCTSLSESVFVKIFSLVSLALGLSDSLTFRLTEKDSLEEVFRVISTARLWCRHL